MKKKYFVRMLGKRILACSLAVVLACSMTACGSRDDEEEEEYEEDYTDYDEEDASAIDKLKYAVKESKLPKAKDGLSKEIAMPLRSEVKIKYPKLMEAEAQKDANVIKFYSTNKKGTADAYASFTVMLIDLSEEEQKYIDSLMGQGPGIAQHYLKEIAEMYTTGTFEEYELETTEDMDDLAVLKNAYVYGCPTEVGGSEWEDAPEDVYGCIFLEYVGSSGYLIAGCAAAPERRAEAYINIAAKIMCGITTDMKWDPEEYAKTKGFEAPVKERPKAPKVEKDEDEDEDEEEETEFDISEFKLKFPVNAGTYFWVDSSDNCWRTNGRKDTYWSDIFHGYVDEDTGEWFDDVDYEWPELKYSDYKGSNSDDDFSDDDDDDDDYDDDDYDDDDDDYDDEDDDYSDDDEDYSDDDDDYSDDDDDDYSGGDDGGSGDHEPAEDGWYYEDGWYIEED